MKGMLWVGEMGAEESRHWYISCVPPKCVWEGKGFYPHLHKASSPFGASAPTTNHITVKIKNPNPFFYAYGSESSRVEEEGMRHLKDFASIFLFVNFSY